MARFFLLMRVRVFMLGGQYKATDRPHLGRKMLKTWPRNLWHCMCLLSGIQSRRNIKA